MTTGTLSERERQDRTPEPPARPRTRRRLLTYGLYALIPLSLAAVVIVLAQMASSAAAATGGCGGG
jgi:hypothetical protein